MKDEAKALAGSALAIMLGALALIYFQSEEFWPSFGGGFIQALFGASFVTLVMFFLYAYLIIYGVLAILSRRSGRFRALIIALPSLAYFSGVYWLRFGELSAIATTIAALTFSGVALAQFWAFSQRAGDPER